MKLNSISTILIVISAFGSSLTADESRPENLSELETATLALAEPCREATVGLSIGNAQGSGVIVTPEGLILTAFHCVQNVGREFEIIFQDGSRSQAITAYGDKDLDIALAFILDDPPSEGWPFRPVKMDGDLANGDWCVAFGNSAGIQSNRPAPMRLGRVLGTRKWQKNLQLITDSTLVSGDSGGPLFDLEGNVVGVNSNVGAESAFANHHARISEVVKLWKETLNGEKPHPDIAVLRKEGEAFAEKRKIPTALDDAQRESTHALLKKQYGDDFPDEVIAIILNAAKISAQTGEVNIQVTPAVVKEIEEAGYDVVKIGLINAEQKKEFDLQSKKKTKEAPDSGLTDAQFSQTSDLLKKQYGEDFPDEVIAIILKNSTVNAQTGAVEIKVTPSVIKQIEKAGFDLVKIGVISEQQREEMKVADEKKEKANDETEKPFKIR